jgi:hypothetical protein
MVEDPPCKCTIQTLNPKLEFPVIGGNPRDFASSNKKPLAHKSFGFDGL